MDKNELCLGSEGNGNQKDKAVLFRELSQAEAVFRKDEKFRAEYIPLMTEDELAALEEGIVRDGIVKDPLVIFQGKLLDGFSRFDIAQKNGLDYRVVELLVETKAEALSWVVGHHVGRRHLTKFSIIEMYLKIKSMYAEMAKKNQGRKDGKFEQMHTLEKIAEKSECGKTYVNMVENILASKNSKLINECRAGDKKIKSAYYDLKSATSKPANPSPEAFDNPKSGEFINRVICGDVIEKMKEINSVFAGSIPLILTSIPFNAAKDYGNEHNDKKDYKTEYLPWLGECVKEFAAALTEGGRLIIECDAIRDEACKEGGSYRRNIFADLCKIVENVAPELSFLGDIVWYKYNPKHFATVGTRNSCRSPRIARNHSYILIWSKGEDHILDHFDNSISDICEEEWEKMVNSVYGDIAGDKDGKRKHGHPAVWPVKLCDRLIRLFSYPDKKTIVLDPFGGIGSTAKAACLTGRSYISIDQNADFCRTAVELLREAQLVKTSNVETDESKITTID